MTDQELLKKAAKAAGITLADEIDSYIPGSRAMWVVGPGGNDAVWNPLNDDGDALRLAVTISATSRDEMFFEVCRYLKEEKETGRPIQEATRRAIVRTAAALAE